MSNLHVKQYEIIIDPGIVDIWLGEITPFNL